MKKVFIGVLLLCLLVCFQSVFADGTCGTNVKYTVKGNTISFSKAMSSRDAVWGEDCGEVFKDDSGVTSVKITDTIRADGSTMWMFYGFYYVEEMDLEKLDVSNVDTMFGMFLDCSSLKSLKISKWDFSHVTESDWMFNGCSALENLDVSGWNTSALISAEGMFEDCSSLKSIDLSRWNTSNLAYTWLMFENCTSLESVGDIGKWNTSKLSWPESMFEGCSSLTYLDVSRWNVSKVKEIAWMFSGCSSLKYLDVSGWNVSNVENMREMFSGCSSLTYLDVSGWDVSNVKYMSGMFSGCSKLRRLDLSNWNTSNVENMDGVFDGCSVLNVLVLGRNTLKKNIFTSMPKYRSNWYYAKSGKAAGNPLPLKTRKGNGSLFTGYKYNTMAGIWSIWKNPVLVSAVTIKNAQGTAINGKTIVIPDNNYQLKASVTPAKSEQSVFWNSSRPEYATVDADGMVTFRKTGTVKFTATAKDVVKKTATVKLTLLPKATKITIKNPKGKDVSGKTITVKTKTYKLSASALPVKAEQTVAWMSSNTTIATVNKNGKVVFKKAGTVTITATSTDRGKKKGVVKLKYAP